MAQTQLPGRQVKDGSVQRADLDTTTAGFAVIAKALAGSGISLTSTGADSGTGDVTITSTRYDFAIFLQGTMTNSEILFDHVAACSFSIAASLSGTQVGARTAATASTTLTLDKNGTNFGTIVFGAGGTTATLTAASSTSFVAGDKLRLTGPATADTTLANVAITLVAVRS